MDRRKIVIGVAVGLLAVVVVAGIAVPWGGSSGGDTAAKSGPATGNPTMYDFSAGS